MGITISSGQTSAVSAGQIQSGDIVLVSGTLNVLSGGTISSTQDMGTVNISAGGAGFGTVLSGPLYATIKPKVSRINPSPYRSPVARAPFAARCQQSAMALTSTPSSISRSER